MIFKGIGVALFQHNFIHKTLPHPSTFPTHHFIVGGVAGFPGYFGFLLSGFLRVRKEINLHIGVRVIPILEQLLQRE